MRARGLPRVRKINEDTDVRKDRCTARVRNLKRAVFLENYGFSTATCSWDLLRRETCAARLFDETVRRFFSRRHNFERNSRKDCNEVDRAFRVNIGQSTVFHGAL